MKKIFLSIALISSLSLFADEDNKIKIKNINPYQQFEDWYDGFFKYAKNTDELYLINDTGDKVVIADDRMAELTKLMVDSVELTLFAKFESPVQGYGYHETISKEKCIIYVLKSMYNILGTVDSSVHFIPNKMGKLKQTTYWRNKDITKFCKEFKDDDRIVNIWLYYNNKLGKVTRLVFEF